MQVVVYSRSGTQKRNNFFALENFLHFVYYAKMKKLICGPMATVSHEAFRHLVEKFGGVDEYYTEMINAPSLLQKGPFEKYYVMNGPCPKKIVWQLTSREKNSMAKAASLLASFGGCGIDINMGCSAPKIVKSGAGIAWMLKPAQETFSMIFAVKDAIEKVQKMQGAKKGISKMRLSVKLRLGAQDFVPEKFFDFCENLCDLGVEQIALHPRTQKEKPVRMPRMSFAEELALRLKEKNTLVIYNGNITDKTSALLALQACPNVAGIMISRAAVQKPWIFSEIRATLPKYFSFDVCRPQCDNFFGFNESNFERDVFCGKKIDLMQLGLEFISLLERFQPKEFFKTRMQRFFSYYCDNFSFAHYIKTKMLNAATPKKARDTFKEYFEQVPKDRFCTPSLFYHF